MSSSQQPGLFVLPPIPVGAGEADVHDVHDGFVHCPRQGVLTFDQEPVHTHPGCHDGANRDPGDNQAG